MKYTILVLLCFLLPTVANGMVVTKVHLQPATSCITDTTALQTVEKPNYRKGRMRIVSGILIGALAAVCFFSSVPFLLFIGTIMLIVAALFFLAGLLSLFDQAVRYGQRKRKAREVGL